MPAMAPKEKERLDSYSGRFGSEIRRRRKAKGWSRQELAERIDAAGHVCSTPTVQSWENGNRKIPLDAIPVIAEIFGISIGAILPKS